MKLLLFYTTWNIIAFFSTLFINDPLYVDSVRGSLLSAYVGVQISHAVFGSDKIYDIYRRWKVRYPAIFDMIVHLVPVLILGFPKTAAGAAIGTSVLVAWYVTLGRNVSPKIYVRQETSRIYDSVMTTVMLIGFAYSCTLTS